MHTALELSLVLLLICPSTEDFLDDRKKESHSVVAVKCLSVQLKIGSVIILMKTYH